MLGRTAFSAWVGCNPACLRRASKEAWARPALKAHSQRLQSEVLDDATANPVTGHVIAHAADTVPAEPQQHRLELEGAEEARHAPGSGHSAESEGHCDAEPAATPVALPRLSSSSTARWRAAPMAALQRSGCQVAGHALVRLS